MIIHDMLFKKKLKLVFYKNIMPIRDEKTYVKMSLEDFIVATERAKKGELKLAAFRAYKAERRMLQCLAMIHDLHRKDTPCAVPKNEMKDKLRHG
jgi:hypothetical protein